MVITKKLKWNFNYIIISVNMSDKNNYIKYNIYDIFGSII